jgi:2-polyprenyl-6-methoxyphenol hydroxylase-like FAD-dependent oxidoreductase
MTHDLMTATLNPAEKNDRPASTTCCIVGGGPGGMILALLLARHGIHVTLLEAHKDFDREFRGDTIHPSVLEILDQLGLAKPLHNLRHSKIYAGPMFGSGDAAFSPVDFRRLKTRYPYIMLIPQTNFLQFIAAEASKYPNFRLLLGAQVEYLIEEGDIVRGVQYMHDGERKQLRAELTVGADGRFSRVRHLAGIEPVKTSPPMDILWFRLPHVGDEHMDSIGGAFAKGKMLVVFDRLDYWQVGYVFPKGGYPKLKADGIEALRQSIVELEPRFAEQVKSLADWHQFSLLSVESSRCERWHKPGLLLIGDAAHVMSPVGGVGINYAIQDAVVAANTLSAPLRKRAVSEADLQRVQSAREFPTKITQFMQSQLQKRVIASALASQKPLHVPRIARLIFKIPFVARIPARLMAYGVRKVRVQEPM